MSDVAIRTEELGKKYRIGGSRERYQTLRDSVMAFARSPFRSLNPPSSEIWALKDVSFEIRHGEAVGIIGRNGAGKSTLLKILSRITEPTTGRVRLKGRVASLLEVGTGFHPELTGRENIFLNGAIMGMTKAEIKSRFDEIVDFAEIEKFLDTPVKRYSSGMYVRLAFAVAAHLEPEILLVDEVLAVGDAQFQKKCLGKMRDVGREGRTVLFVSHNMSAINLLCDSAIMIKNGELADCGNTGGIIARYLTSTAEAAKNSPLPRRGVCLQSVEFTSLDGDPADTIVCGNGAKIRISYGLPEEKVIQDVIITIGLYDIYGARVTTLSNQWASDQTWHHIRGKGIIDCEMPEIPIAPGHITANVAFDGFCGDERFHDEILNALSLTVVPSDYLGTARMPATMPGLLVLRQAWNLREDNK